MNPPVRSTHPPRRGRRRPACGRPRPRRGWERRHRDPGTGRRSAYSLPARNTSGPRRVHSFPRKAWTGRMTRPTREPPPSWRSSPRCPAGAWACSPCPRSPSTPRSARRSRRPRSGRRPAGRHSHRRCCRAAARRAPASRTARCWGSRRSRPRPSPPARRCSNIRSS